MEESTKGKSTFGLDKNIACSLTYLFGWVSGLVFFLVEKKDEEVRFHALQSTFLFGAVTLVNLVLGRIPIIGWMVMPFLGLGAFILWIVLLVKTYQGEKMILPIVGEQAQKYAKAK